MNRSLKMLMSEWRRGRTRAENTYNDMRDTMSAKRLAYA